MKIKDSANTAPEQRVTPPPSVIDRACKIAAASPCRSKRGAVIFGWSVGILFIAGSDHNGPPEPFTCPDRELCSRNCEQRSVHAEARALRDAADYHDLELDLVHVELADDGHVIVCDGPSCWQCAREILDVGFIAGVWLYEDTRPRCQREPMALRYHWRIDETGTRIDCPECGGSGRIGQSAGTWRRYAAEEFYRLTLERCGIQPSARMPLPSATDATLCPHCEAALPGFIRGSRPRSSSNSASRDETALDTRSPGSRDHGSCNASAPVDNGLEGRGVRSMHPRVINVSFDVTQEVAAALRALRDTGLYGSGVDCASVAEELLRRALLDPEVTAYWQRPPRDDGTGPYVCRNCGHAHATWAARCPSCLSLAGLKKSPRKARAKRAKNQRSP